MAKAKVVTTEVSELPSLGELFKAADRILPMDDKVATELAKVQAEVKAMIANS